MPTSHYNEIWGSHVRTFSIHQVGDSDQGSYFNQCQKYWILSQKSFLSKMYLNIWIWITWTKALTLSFDQDNVPYNLWKMSLTIILQMKLTDVSELQDWIFVKNLALEEKMPRNMKILPIIQEFRRLCCAVQMSYWDQS